MADFPLIFQPNGDNATVNNQTYPQLNYYPWDWYVKSNATDVPQCSISRASILSTFAAVNIAVAVLGVIVGHRSVRQTVTPQRIQTEDRSWPWAFVFPILLQLAGNALIAFLYKRTLEYWHGYSVQDLLLFYMTRPRFGWFFMSILLPISGKSSSYAAAAKGAVLAEIFLLIFGSYYMGRTAHFAATQGFYKTNALAGSPYVWSALVMYSGALLFLVSLLPAIASGIMLLRFGRGVRIYFFVFFMSFSSLLGSWLFWDGFVYLAGDL